MFDPLKTPIAVRTKLGVGESSHGLAAVPVAVCMVLLLAGCLLPPKTEESKLFGPEEALHVDGPIDYPGSPLNPLIQQLTAAKPQAEKVAKGDAHSITLLDIGDDALLARIHLIRQAQRSICIQTFIWDNDECTRFIAFELLQAARRGVKVRVIADAWVSAPDPDYWAWLATANPNMEFRLYNPNLEQIAPSGMSLFPYMLLNLHGFSQRMHDKTFIIDDRVAIIGGRNYENDYFDRGAIRNFRDLDILIVGPVVREITDSFERYWAYHRTLPLCKILDVAAAIQANTFPRYQTPEDCRERGLFDTLRVHLEDPAYLRARLVDRAYRVDDVEFVCDVPGKNISKSVSFVGTASERMVAFLSAARESIWAESPYFIFDRRSMKLIDQLRKDHPGIDLRVVTNSLASTDNTLTYAMMLKQKKLLVKDRGFRIFEQNGHPADMPEMMADVRPNDEPAAPAATTSSGKKSDRQNPFEVKGRFLSLHAKFYLRDDDACWIGSYNIHPRSYHLDTEIGLIIRDRPFAGAIRTMMLRDQNPRNSWAVGVLPEVPVLTGVNDFLLDASYWLPMLDVWPFRATSCYQKINGKPAVPFTDPTFYENYRNVGQFPGVDAPDKTIQVELLKTLAGLIKPLT